MEIEDMSIESIETFLQKKKENLNKVQGAAFDFEVKEDELVINNYGRVLARMTDSIPALKKALKIYEEVNGRVD